MRAGAYAVPNIFSGVNVATSKLRPPFSLGRSRIRLILVCLGITGALGYLDYRTGYEQTFLLFYLVPIALGTWFGGWLLGFSFAILSVLTWITSDIAAGIPTVGWWNIGMAMGSYTVFTGLLVKLRSVLRELDQRVRDRTEALRHEMAERARLDREIGTVADRERRRLGQELHDTLCQHLTGIALTAETLRENLAMRAAPEVSEADKVVRYLEEGIDLTRNLARGFFSPELDVEGLGVALQGLAENMSERFQIPCQVELDESVAVTNSNTATHLYRIAQEAVMNAIKHARASRIEIRLGGTGDGVALEISDDGVGFEERISQPQGLGLRLMSHGAALIGADFRILRNMPRGTTVSCKLNSVQPVKHNSHDLEN
jgi:signal transduction histidine kinase